MSITQIFLPENLCEILISGQNKGTFDFEINNSPENPATEYGLIGSLSEIPLYRDHRLGGFILVEIPEEKELTRLIPLESELNPHKNK